jgi:hypothetical protein
VTPPNFVSRRRLPPRRRARGAITPAIVCRKIFCRRDCARKIRHRLQVPMPCGFLRTFSRAVLAKLRTQCDTLARNLRRGSLRVTVHLPYEKNYAPDGFRGTLAARSRRKSRESVPTDSRRRLRRAATCCLASSLRESFSVPFRRRGSCAAAACDCRGGSAPNAQTPSFFFKRSLTACGFALPPDALITWPTNQPIALGLVLASATLSGFLPTMSSTSFSIAERSVSC